MYSYVTMAQRIPDNHPARAIRAMVDRALDRMDAELEQLYSHTGRLSVRYAAALDTRCVWQTAGCRCA